MLKVEKILSVLSKMDDDLDGALKAEHVMRVLKLLSEDSEGMSASLFEEVVEMMVKEDQLSAQSLVEKTLTLPAFSLDMSVKNNHLKGGANQPPLPAGSTLDSSKNDIQPRLDEVEKIIGLKGAATGVSKKPSEVHDETR